MNPVESHRTHTPAGDVLDYKEVQQQDLNGDRLLIERDPWEPRADALMLNLQRSAGNRAVCSLGQLQRNRTNGKGLSSDPLVVQRTDKHTDAELMTLMQKFRASNKKLSEDQQNKIFWSLKQATDGGDEVAYKLLDYYTGWFGQDMRPMTDAEETDAAKADELMNTKAHGDTLISKRAFALDNGVFGPLLIHEFSHTGQESNWMRSRDYQEGYSYAIEYFYAEKNNSPRAAKILTIISACDFARDQKAAIQANFRNTYGAMTALRDLATTGSSSIAPLKGLTAADGPSLTAQFIAETASPPDTVVKLLEYVKSHQGEFKIPAL